jgi:hypothetical protein
METTALNLNEASKWRGADVIAPLRLRRAGEARNADWPFLVSLQPTDSFPTDAASDKAAVRQAIAFNALCLNVTANAKNCVQTSKEARDGPLHCRSRSTKRTKTTAAVNCLSSID